MTIGSRLDSPRGRRERSVRIGAAGPAPRLARTARAHRAQRPSRTGLVPARAGRPPLPRRARARLPRVGPPADDDRPGGEIMQGAASFPQSGQSESRIQTGKKSHVAALVYDRPNERPRRISAPSSDLTAMPRHRFPTVWPCQRPCRSAEYSGTIGTRTNPRPVCPAPNPGVGEVDGDDDRQHADRDPVHDDRVDEPCRDPVAVGGEAGHHVLRRRLLGKGADGLPARRAEHGACQKLRAAVHAVPLTRFHPNSQPHGGRNPGSRCRSSAKPRSAISLTREGGRRGTLEVTRERR